MPIIFYIWLFGFAWGSFRMGGFGRVVSRRASGDDRRQAAGPGYGRRPVSATIATMTEAGI
jgi:hypothetical protein